jgi:CheY-like chemotaxis protein
MEDLLRRSIGEGVEMETIVSPSLWNAFADPTQIENAVLNLAINARDAMDGMGKLTIEVRNAHLDHAYSAHNPGIDPGQYVMLAVSDTGSGIPSEIMERVFEPFFTTKAEGKGSGLGLSMVYGFAKQSGGHVKIYSEVGEGTTVRLYLPRVHDSEDVAPGPELVEAGGGSETILVVEDDTEVRGIATEMLRELGYKVLTAKDAASAVPIIESGVKIDVLFTDVVMPGPVRSPELARKAKELIPGIAILFTSGYTENAIVHGGRLDPGVNLLTKPYSRQALATRIRDVLDRARGGTSSAG